MRTWALPQVRERYEHPRHCERSEAIPIEFRARPSSEGIASLRS